MARLAGKARGDMRAMEEQSERHNPVRGCGATPSMGLSQFRGGGTGGGEDSDSDEELVGGGAGEMTRMVGSGTGGRRRKGMSEATQMGLHLGKHLNKLHGGGFVDDFKQGFMSFISPVAGIACWPRGYGGCGRDGCSWSRQASSSSWGGETYDNSWWSNKLRHGCV